MVERRVSCRSRFNRFFWHLSSCLLRVRCSEKVPLSNQVCFLTENYLTDPIGLDNGRESFGYLQCEYDTIILDGAEKTRFLMNISLLSCFMVLWRHIYPFLKKNTVVVIHDTNTFKYSKLVEDLLLSTSLNLMSIRMPSLTPSSVFSDPLYPVGISVFKKTE